MTLSFEFDLDILPLNLHAEIQVCMSVRLAVREVTDRQTDRQTHTPTHRHTMSKLLHLSLTRDVKILAVKDDKFKLQRMGHIYYLISVHPSLQNVDIMWTFYIH